MCSYWRSRFLVHASCGIAVLPSRLAEHPASTRQERSACCTTVRRAAEAARGSAAVRAQMTHPPSEHEHSADIAGVESVGMEGGVGGEEGLDAADVADRVEEDPENQPNRVDPDYAQDEGDPV